MEYGGIHTICNEQIKVLGVCIPSNIFLFVVLGVFKLLSRNYLELHN